MSTRKDKEQVLSDLVRLMVQDDRFSDAFIREELKRVAAALDSNDDSEGGDSNHNEKVKQAFESVEAETWGVMMTDAFADLESMDNEISF